MATTPTGDVTAETAGSVTADTGGAGNAGTGDGGKTAADEIRALRKRAQEAEGRAETLAKAEAARQDAEALARGEHESVIAKLRAENEQLSTKAAQFEAAQTARRETLLTGLTDDDRALADGLPLDKLEGLVARLGRAPAVHVPVHSGVPGGAVQTGTATAEEVRMNIGNPAWYQANKHRL